MCLPPRGPNSFNFMQFLGEGCSGEIPLDPPLLVLLYCVLTFKNCSSEEYVPACNHVIDDLSCNILHVYIFM